MSDIDKEDDMLVEDYRPFSAVGLVALIACVVLGGLALINASLVILPLFAALGAAFLLVKLHTGEVQQGRRMVALGMAFCLFAFTTIIAFETLRNQHCREIAIKYSGQWLDLVAEGKVYEPFQLTQRINDREAEGTDLAAALGNYESLENAAIFSYALYEPEVTIRKLGKEEAKYDCEGVTAHVKKPYRTETFDVTYKLNRLNPGFGENDGDRIFVIQMQRQHCVQPWYVQWQVSAVVNVDPSITRRGVTTQKLIE